MKFARSPCTDLPGPELPKAKKCQFITAARTIMNAFDNLYLELETDEKRALQERHMKRCALRSIDVPRLCSFEQDVLSHTIYFVP